MSELTDKLQRLRDQITPDNLCWRFVAENDQGYEVSVESSRAVRWCLLGHIWKLFPSCYDHDPIEQALERVLNKHTQEGSYTFTAREGVTACHDLIDKAIKANS